MKIKTLSVSQYEIPLIGRGNRLGALLQITDEMGRCSCGEIAPLPNWSVETLQEAVYQIEGKKEDILRVEWDLENFFKEIASLSLLPSVLFGLESALLSLLNPIPTPSVKKSALLMGSLKEILDQALLRKKEGYISAKLKVGNLKFEDAYEAIFQLKDVFHLRVDVNRAWQTKEALDFFSKFSLEAFDYIEEPFQDPHDLGVFTHPLAVDESFPADLSLSQLETFSTLKALIYKPTIQGGMTNCLPLLEWCKARKLDLVLSSSFESDIGLGHIESMAHRLSLKAPVGTGTYDFLREHLIKK